ncbi:hypothetical protein V502_10949 [Pseudogymnoascus sp. VKM F-4520 (FW-2644)]|nr:hypothetical protein V502_10949 [Pseudogymnoascus sp. VKM F-4520 (FW-2644)]
MDSLTPPNPKEILQRLTLKEKVVSLLAGANLWQTAAIDRLGVFSVKVSDGPNGVRGSQFFDGVPAACFPAAVALAATWDRELVEMIGQALAEEAISKGVATVLGPTICLHRSPLGGRNFEAFSEDPLLTGELASKYISGLQARGIGATVKHYACNEQETLRYTIDVKVGERALREIYLKSFEIVIRKSKPWALMTAYNLVNGTHVDSNKHLLQTILREQWGYDGLVMSDWGGTNSVAEALTAGVDLEMPGPAYRRTFNNVTEAIDQKALSLDSVDRAALSVLRLAERAGRLGKSSDVPERAENKPTHRQLIRKAGIRQHSILGMGKCCFAHGGGSAIVNCHYKVTPFEALQELLPPDVEIRYAQGAHVFRKLPDWKEGVVDIDGNPGFTLRRYQNPDLQSQPEATINTYSSKYLGVENRCAAVVLEGFYQPAVSGSHFLAFSTMGLTNFLINDEVVHTSQNVGMMTGQEERKQFAFIQGEQYRIRVESFGAPFRPEMPLITGMVGFDLGFMTQQEYDEDLLQAAVDAACSVDVALVFVGNTVEWETEGWDRQTMELPANGSQDRLIEAVAKVNSNTIVLNSTCSAISMPWLSSVPAVLQTWFLGQESGNAIIDVLFSISSPGGKLPISITHRIEDSPSYGNFPGNLNTMQVHYKEGIEVGYRHFDKHPDKIQFPFGFGLSYTIFEFSNIRISGDEVVYGTQLEVDVDVTNVGNQSGKEVVQIYVAALDSNDDMPVKVLAGFDKVDLIAGQCKTAMANITFESFAFWDTAIDSWKVTKGQYDILLGNSSINILARRQVTVKETFTYSATLEKLM